MTWDCYSLLLLQAGSRTSSNRKLTKVWNSWEKIVSVRISFFVSDRYACDPEIFLSYSSTYFFFVLFFHTRLVGQSKQQIFASLCFFPFTTNTFVKPICCLPPKPPSSLLRLRQLQRPAIMQHRLNPQPKPQKENISNQSQSSQCEEKYHHQDCNQAIMTLVSITIWGNGIWGKSSMTIGNSLRHSRSH